MICERCDSEFSIHTDRKLICPDCKVQLDLLDEEKKVNDRRINKLLKHKEAELKNPTTDETMKRLERNLQIEYKKRDGIINAINSKSTF
ncbi:MAG: hypothetical protein ACW9W3_07490 [Candidatus Nitrosopumilus sp. bin_68KS]